MRFIKTVVVVMLLTLICYITAAIGSASRFNLAVKEFSLDNGMMFLVVERHVTPQVACRLAVRAGAAFEDTGKTGIAHMLEHMMFKGTKNFGTLDYKRDQELQGRIEVAYQ
ncbi:MAG: insulinase family protein, partial [Deltaproteobacteria bacterium]|nr:insulinase family protein [Deltaproteobacteria bacterium]